jgi:hypothetical protein
LDTRSWGILASSALGVGNGSDQVAYSGGHSAHPFRVLNTIAAIPLFTKLPGWQAITWLVSVTWIGIAVSERLADLYALNNCSLAGLKVAFQHFDQAAKDPVLRFPPDRHASNALRAYAIKNRIAQLEAEPDKEPIQIPLPIKVQLG